MGVIDRLGIGASCALRRVRVRARCLARERPGHDRGRHSRGRSGADGDRCRDGVQGQAPGALDLDYRWHQLAVGGGLPCSRPWRLPLWPLRHACWAAGAREAPRLLQRMWPPRLGRRPLTAIRVGPLMVRRAARASPTPPELRAQTHPQRALALGTRRAGSTALWPRRADRLPRGGSGASTRASPVPRATCSKTMRPAATRRSPMPGGSTCWGASGGAPWWAPAGSTCALSSGGARTRAG